MKMKFGIWQIIYVGLTLIGVGLAAGKHGQPRTDKWNVWATLIAAVIDIAILAFGGFFG